jgi:hypothetical protein
MVLFSCTHFFCIYFHIIIYSSVRGVYVLETAEHNAQAAISVADIQQQQHQVQQVPAPHFHPQAQPHHHHHHQQPQAQTYYNNPPLPTQAAADAAVHMSQGQNMQVTGNCLGCVV